MGAAAPTKQMWWKKQLLALRTPGVRVGRGASLVSCRTPKWAVFDAFRESENGWSTSSATTSLSLTSAALAMHSRPLPNISQFLTKFRIFSCQIEVEHCVYAHRMREPPRNKKRQRILKRHRDGDVKILWGCADSIFKFCCLNLTYLYVKLLL